MKRIAYKSHKLFILLALFWGCGNVSAIPFTLDSIDLSLNTTHPGLNLYAFQILPTPVSFDLDEGDTIAAPLFGIGTTETWVNPDDFMPMPIVATLNFSEPLITASIGGTSSGNSIFYGFLQWGGVSWNSPQSILFGNGGQITIALNDVVFGTGFWGLTRKPAVVGGRMRLDSVSVPEPGTLALLGIGLVGLGFSRTMRRGRGMKALP